MQKFEVNYSALDKALHHLVFKNWSIMSAISDIESKMYKNKLSSIEIKAPVFITALPRAGTTLLLDICHNSGEFATHTYKDMPFLMTPILWNTLSKNFRVEEKSMLRAHGDGMSISSESPEAFEEIFWKNFWLSHYKKESITPWKDNTFEAFDEFFKEHIKKLIYIKDKENKSLRYISKNNLNISRISYLKKMFPDSIIIVPFRHPLEHANSLLKQHLNFSNMHENDSFSSKYMEDIGHFDFGKNFKPILFDELCTYNISQADKLTFWLKYWIDTYTYILNEHEKEVVFLCYEDFCTQPHMYLNKLSKILNIEDRKNFIKSSPSVTLNKKSSVVSNTDKAYLKDAEVLYSKLKALSF